MYFSSVFPYVVLFIFLIRGMLLDGAIDGITYMFYPKVSRQDMFSSRKSVLRNLIGSFFSMRSSVIFHSLRFGGTYRCGARQLHRCFLHWVWAMALLSHIPPTIQSTTTATGMPWWSPASTLWHLCWPHWWCSWCWVSGPKPSPYIALLSMYT